MEKPNASIEAPSLEKWGYALNELYRLALSFYKQNTGKAIHLSYEDNLKLIAFKQQAAVGPFNPNDAPALGVLDVIGKDRRMHWQALGYISREQAMEGFIDLLDKMCTAFHPYIDAVRENRDETLRQELKRMEVEKIEKEKREKEQKEALEESYKEEIQRRQLQDALNKQTYEQFKSYAEKQFPGNPEQQAVLIHQLQQEHYHQYMQQLHMQNQNTNLSMPNNNNAETPAGDGTKDADSQVKTEKSVLNENAVQSVSNNEEGGSEDDKHEPKHSNSNLEQSEDDDEYVLIKPAKIWTRPDIEEFKAEVTAGEGDGCITIGHGDTVTVRVPTNANGKCIFWEFATDNYDIGFGIYFEWSKPVTNEVTVHISDSDDEDDYTDEDYLSTTDDLECGGTNDTTLANTSSGMKPPISIIVPIYRRECFNEVYVGSHSYPGEGVYLLKFDNSFSIWRSKTLYYRVYYER